MSNRLIRVPRFETAAPVYQAHGNESIIKTCVQLSIVIFVFSNLLIGQLAFASAAHSANLAAFIPGTLAFTSRWLSVIAPFSKVMVHFVSILSGSKSCCAQNKTQFHRKTAGMSCSYQFFRIGISTVFKTASVIIRCIF